jgi:hypothetical protein
MILIVVLKTHIPWLIDNPVCSTNTTNYHNITEVLLKVALNTIIDKIKWHVTEMTNKTSLLEAVVILISSLYLNI